MKVEALGSALAYTVIGIFVLSVISLLFADLLRAHELYEDVLTLIFFLAAPALCCLGGVLYDQIQKRKR